MKLKGPILKCLTCVSVLLLTIGNGLSFGQLQKTDSVEMRAKQLGNTLQAALYLLKQADKKIITDPEKSEKYSLMAKNIATKNKFLREEAFATFYTGHARFLQRDFEKGKEIMQGSLLKWQAINLLKDTGYLLNLITLSFLDRDSVKSELLATQAYNLSTQMNNKKYIAKSLRQLGFCDLIYRNNKQQALKQFQQALQFAYASGDLLVIGEVHESISNVYSRENNYPLAIDELTQAIEKFKTASAHWKTVGALNTLSNLYASVNNNEKAIGALVESIRILSLASDKQQLIIAYTNLANHYLLADDFRSSFSYLKKAEDLSAETRNSKYLYEIYRSYASAYEYSKNFEKALEYSKKEVAEAEKLEGPGIIARAYINQAEIYFLKGQFNEALTTLDKSIAPAREYNDLTKDETTSFAWEIDLNRSRYLFAKGDTVSAIEYAESAWNQISGSSNALNRYRVASHLANLYATVSRYKESIEFKNLAFQLNDSINSIEKNKLSFELLTKFEIEKRDKEIELLSKESQLQSLILKQRESELELEKVVSETQLNQLKLAEKDKVLKETELRRTNIQLEREKAEKELINQQRLVKVAQTEKQKQFLKFLLAGVLLLAISLISILIALYQKQKHNKIIEYEKKRSDELLLNILPAETAEELKDFGKAKAKSYTSATILFTDFVSFTTISSSLSAEQLVDEIDHCYKGFDEIITKYGIEKIKTIGDSYMAASGLPQEDPEHAVKCVNAAWDILEFMREYKKQRQLDAQTFFELRIGINTGPVVAGIVGVKKFAYDIWGDTVNVASRIEQNSEPGRINISQSTYELVKHAFNCTYRGKIDAKNKGLVDMYFVDSKIENPLTEHEIKMAKLNS